MHTPRWLVRESPLPASLDDPDETALRTFLAVHALEEAVSTATWGWADLVEPAADQLRTYATDRYLRRVLLVAEPAVDDAATTPVVGYALAELPLADNLHLAEVELVVDPAHRRQGVGSLLLERLHEVLRADGRTHVVVGSEHVAEPMPDDVLTPRTGVGAVRSSEPASAFLRAHGYALEQTMRYSVLPLPAAPGTFTARTTTATLAAGPDYTVLTWEDHAPEEHLEAYASLLGAMSTDAPFGDIALEPESWDGARVRNSEDIAAGGRLPLTAAALHVPSGELAGYTTLQVPLDHPEMAFQHDTLVRKGHRGHRLGMLLKAANLERLAEAAPAVRRVHTWNAAENRHMLAVNEALGFAKVGLVGEWQRQI